MEEITLKVLSGLKWWAGFFTVMFLMVLISSPSLFGIHFISGSAIASCLIYAFIGFFIGFRRVKRREKRVCYKHC